MKDYQIKAILAIRLIGLILIILGLWVLFSNVIETSGDFNPAFAAYYFKSQLLRPLLACAFGVILQIISRKLGISLTKDLEQE